MSTIPELDLRFASTSLADTGSYKLLELPPDLCKLIEGASDEPNVPQYAESLFRIAYCNTDP